MVRYVAPGAREKCGADFPRAAGVHLIRTLQAVNGRKTRSRKALGKPGLTATLNHSVVGVTDSCSDWTMRLTSPWLISAGLL